MRYDCLRSATQDWAAVSRSRAAPLRGAQPTGLQRGCRRVCSPPTAHRRWTLCVLHSACRQAASLQASPGRGCSPPEPPSPFGGLRPPWRAKRLLAARVAAAGGGLRLQSAITWYVGRLGAGASRLRGRRVLGVWLENGGVVYTLPTHHHLFCDVLHKHVGGCVARVGGPISSEIGVGKKISSTCILLSGFGLGRGGITPTGPRPYGRVEPRPATT